MPDAMESELEHCSQLRSSGIDTLPEPETPTVVMSSRLYFSLNLDISATTASRGPVVTLSSSRWDILPSPSTSASLALMDPMSMPKNKLIYPPKRIIISSFQVL